MLPCWKLSKILDRWNPITRLLIRGILLFAFASSIGAPIISDRAAAEDTAQSLLGEADSAIQKPEKGTRPAVGETTPALADELTHTFHMTQERYKLYECVLLAAFALVALVVILRVLCNKPNCTATHMVNASGLVFIIFGTLFLVLLADVDAQLNAGMGILGAVAGYLFGTMRRMESEEKPEPQKS